MNRIKLLIVGVASMGIASFAAAADEAVQTPPCAQQPPARMDCMVSSTPGGMEGCVMMSSPGMGPRHGMFAPKGRGPMGQCDFMGGIPKEIRDRMDALRTDREALAELWQKAVLARGDKPVDTLRDDFAKANAELIAKIDKSGKSIQEDLRALREGYDKEAAKCPMMDDEVAYGFKDEGAGPHLMKVFVNRLDEDIVAEIQALKEPLTVEKFAEIRARVIAQHSRNLDMAFGCQSFSDQPFGMHEMMPPMDPALSRMRKEMRGMHGEKLEARKELRNQLREAMKIKDAAKREAAVKKILDKSADENADHDDDDHDDNR